MTATAPLLHEELATRLGERRAEIEGAMLGRAYSIADPAAVRDPGYVAGLRAAVSAAVPYAIAALRGGGERPAPVPAELLAQARHAARDEVPLDTVLRRYLAGHALLEEFIIQEAEADSALSSAHLRDALRAAAATLDHLIDAVAIEYRGEIEARVRSLDRRRSERVKKLLAGASIDVAELEYDFSAWHLGAIAVGPGAREALRALARGLDRRPLLVRQGEDTLWAWLGGQRPERHESERLTGWEWPGGVRVAIGEPAQGLSGWRLTHRQAAAALPIALRGPRARVRYAEVILLASALQDETLTATLRDLYLTPLADDRDGGMTLRQTLRAYFAAERNVSSTAVGLQVDRKTVTARLRTAERRIGRPIDACAAELEVALRMEEMSAAVVPSGFPRRD